MGESHENNTAANTTEIHSSAVDQERIGEIEAFSAIKDTFDNIEKEKRQFQGSKIDVEGNQADNLFFFQNAIINGGVSSGGHSVREVLRNSSKVEKDYDLSDAEQFAEFGETVKAGEHFAIAIILCIFEYIELDDLHDLKLKLLAELPKTTDEDGKELSVYQNPYLSINSLLKTVRGEMVVLDSGEQCVRLGKKRPEALKNLWQQFPEMRKHIARWMLKISDSFKYQTNFDTIQITSAFVNILKLDFKAGVYHFFSRFYSDPNKFWILGFVGLELYNDLNYRNKISPYIMDWFESDSTWLWKSAIYIYSNLKADEDVEGFNERARKTLLKHCKLHEYNDLFDGNLPYLGMLLTVSERLRTLIASILNRFISSTYNYNKKRLYCFWYLEIIRYGYYLVSPEMTVLPLVACDKKRQLEDILPLLEIVFSVYDTRRFLLIILNSYLRELSKYNLDKKTVDHIKAFFQVIAECNPRFRDDIILFLLKCNCSFAQVLEEFLIKVLRLSNTSNPTI